MRKFSILLIAVTACCLSVSGQSHFSIATDVAAMRNFSAAQQFTTLGQNVSGQYFFGNTTGAYVQIGYFLPGKFDNDFIATARPGSPAPATRKYNVSGSWRFRQVSAGLKQFVSGRHDAEAGKSFYILGGFGLLLSRAENTLSSDISQADYELAKTPALGTHDFTRLTLDAGLGIEIPLSIGFFFYTELKTWIPMSDYPSDALHRDSRVPYPVIAAAGLRLQFGNY
ncbi:MAG TPA: hypothetical protein VFZ78_00150 [Flavisolibacter sp.]